MAGPSFFLHWLTKYPNFGPINWEVLLGIVCVVMAGTVPVVMALFYVRGKRSLLQLGALLLAAYVAVLVRLDLSLWDLGLFGAIPFGGHQSIPVREALGGPALRSLGLIGGLALLIRSRLRSGRR